MEKSIKCRADAVLDPAVTALAYGCIGRGVREISMNENGELIFTMSDGNEITLGKIPFPSASAETAGAIKVGENLKISPEGILSVDTASQVEKDNTKPITSGAVHTEIGNIEILLENI